MNYVNNGNCCTGMQAKYHSTRPAVLAQNRVDGFSDMPLAMAYVPKQSYSQMFDLQKGLKMGTIFPELCLPFCGKRRNCSCQTRK